MRGEFSGGVNMKGLEELQRKAPGMFALAMEKAALQMLTWMATGSPREARTPPIRTGVLRGSGSAFVGKKLVGVAPPSPGSKGGTPARSGDAGPLEAHWVYNTEYAAKMHEWDGGWGQYTEQAADAGNKWLEKHIRADREAFAEMIAVEFGKGLK